MTAFDVYIKMMVSHSWYDLVWSKVKVTHTYNLTAALNANILTLTFKSYVIAATWTHSLYLHNLGN